MDLEQSAKQGAEIGDAAHNNALRISGDFTIECWVKFESVTRDQGGPMSWTLMSKANLHSGGGGYALSWNAMQKKLTLWVGKSARQAYSPGIAWTPTAGQWTHIAASCDASGSMGVASF